MSRTYTPTGVRSGRRRLILLGLLLAHGLGGGCASERPPPPAQEERPESDPATADGELPLSLTRDEGIPEGGVELGYGWDSRRGEVVPSRCIAFAPVRATGQVATLSMREVSDQSEVMESLGVSASVSVKTIFASGSAQASFARDTKVSATTTNLLLQATRGSRTGCWPFGHPSTR